ncbi:MAG: biotin/lipoyl-binding protein, partial [Armatimonadetes bacterium]|nr:biotin/lipoyl-binding protein [Armatimonadota bacterium]
MRPRTGAPPSAARSRKREVLPARRSPGLARLHAPCGPWAISTTHRHPLDTRGTVPECYCPSVRKGQRRVPAIHAHGPVEANALPMISGKNRVGPPAPAMRRLRAAAVRRMLSVVGIAAVVGAVAYYRSRPARVETAAPVVESVTESIAATGRIEGAQETDVSSPVPGRVRRLLVAEGDRVESGAPLAILDNSVETAGVEAARATLVTAQAQLRQASAPTRRSELARIRADADQSVRAAQARLTASEHRLAELVRGPTPEQIESAAAALSSAEYRSRAATSTAAQTRARLVQAERDLRRQTALAADGAVSQSEADRAQTARDEAEAAL